MSTDDAAKAGKIFADLAEKLHRPAPAAVRTGHPAFDRLIDAANERSRTLVEAGIQLAASAAAEAAATIFEGRAS